ncbi:MAG TPA: glycosyltransferase [Leptolyngbyaceae cyanobacterium]
MRIFFLDQSANLGGAELCLFDIVQAFSKEDILIGLLAEGSFHQFLETNHIPSLVLTQKTLNVRKESSLWQGLSSVSQLLPLVLTAARKAKAYDIIYANTPKALIVGALASRMSGRPLVYHLHDIISPEHFSAVNSFLLVTLANRFAKLVIANSQASKAAFIAAGGNGAKIRVVYNGFRLGTYQLLGESDSEQRNALRQQLGLTNEFVVGHFSRLAPWKGQHVLLEALSHLPQNVVCLLVGSALFGEDDYVLSLHQQVEALKLGDRVHFLGFRSDIPKLMTACDLVAHTSTAPEPFGRVIVEAMLCARPVVAAAAGGAVELVEHGRTGWLCPPNDSEKLADIISTCQTQTAEADAIAHRAQQQARERFDVRVTNGQIQTYLAQLVSSSPKL